jgi:hypothetical protein
MMGTHETHDTMLTRLSHEGRLNAFRARFNALLREYDNDRDRAMREASAEFAPIEQTNGDAAHIQRLATAALVKHEGPLESALWALRNFYTPWAEVVAAPSPLAVSSWVSAVATEPPTNVTATTGATHMRTDEAACLVIEPRKALAVPEACPARRSRRDTRGVVPVLTAWNRAARPSFTESTNEGGCPAGADARSDGPRSGT